MSALNELASASTALAVRTRRVKRILNGRHPDTGKSTQHQSDKTMRKIETSEKNLDHPDSARFLANIMT